MESSSSTAITLVFHGHASANPKTISDLFGGQVDSQISEHSDAAIFCINPSAGIDPETIELWHQYSELQTPRLVIVTTLAGSEMDFDDAVLLANRVFDQLVTPYLVLHGLDGSPIGLIDLLSKETFDYSTFPPTIDRADSELEQLVEEFAEEYASQIEEMGEDAFAAGLIFPAIPVNLENQLGIDVVKKYLAQLPSRS